MEITLNFYSTLCAMVFVLLLGTFIIKHVKFLRVYNIPEPVVGGIIVAILLFIANKYIGISFNFDGSLKDPLMLAFYATIGLSADFASLKKGGKVIIGFLFIVTGLLILQNLAGIGVALAMGENPIIGMLSGSITMSGGHGTGAAWAAEFIKEPYNYAPALEVAMAAATFGLIAGGIIGGPVARYLVVKNNLSGHRLEEKVDLTLFEKPEKRRLITSSSFVESLALIAICLLVGTELKKIVTFVTMPTFVWCLLTGAVLRNVLSATKIHTVFDHEISVIGNVSLSLFLAFALMTINIAQLISLALPMLTILIVQIILMILYVIFITFRFCGKNYDAAVLSAGHCGFGLGATPTALVNMQTVTKHYGPSHMAFIVIPLVGAFFIDIINAFIISAMMGLPIFN